MTVDWFKTCTLSVALVLWSTTSIDDTEFDCANELKENSEARIPESIFDLFMRMKFIN